MKLNPPETAPRDGTLILGYFHEYGLFPTAWRDSTPDIPDLDSLRVTPWMVMQSKKYEGKNCAYFSLSDFSHACLRGWLPMPQIDDEGTVTWPTASPA